MGDDDVEEGDRSQNLGAHFVRACAVEMQVSISQEPLFTEIYRKNAAARMKQLGAERAKKCKMQQHHNFSKGPPSLIACPNCKLSRQGTPNSLGSWEDTV